MVRQTKTRVQISLDKNLLKEFKFQLSRDSPGVTISQKIVEWIIQYIHKLKR